MRVAVKLLKVRYGGKKLRHLKTVSVATYIHVCEYCDVDGKKEQAHIERTFE